MLNLQHAPQNTLEGASCTLEAERSPNPETFFAQLRLAISFCRYLRPRGLVVLLVGCTVLAGVVHLPLTFLPKVFTEHFHDRGFLLLYLSFALAALGFGWILSMLQTYWGTRLGENVLLSLRSQVFGKLEWLPLARVYGRGPGEFVQQVSRDVMVVRDLFDETLLRAGLDLAHGAAVLVALLALDPLLTVAALAAFLAATGVLRWVNRRVEHHAQRSREQHQEILDCLVESVGGFRDIVSAGRFGRFADRFDRLLRANQQTNVRTAVWAQLAGQVPAAVVSLMVLAVYGLGWQRANDLSEVGTIITYALLLGQLLPAVMAVTDNVTELALAAPSLRALRDLLDESPAVSPLEPVPLEGPIGSIEFCHVTVELEGRRIVEDLTFTIPAGQLTVLVGPSGAGKTTILNLLLRLIEPTAGAIFVNDRPLEQYTLESLRAHFGLLPQNPFIFNASLRENILLATGEEVSAEDLDRAIALAQLEEVVHLRQDQSGLDAEAGYLGNSLSGGERQRIALARLILRDPSVILCDEHTSNIDVKTAHLIHEALRQHFAGRTRILITHELHAARGADWIIVLDQGRVVQQGTSEELRSLPGLYREFVALQSI